MAFSQEEEQILQWAKDNGKTGSETRAAIFRFRTTGSPAVTAGTPTVGRFADIPSDIGETVEGIKGAVQEGFQTARDVQGRVEAGETTPLSGTLQTIGAGLRAGATAIGEGVVGLGKLFTSPREEEAIKRGLTAGVEKVAQTEPVQRVMEKFGELPEDTQRNIKAGLGVAEGVTTLFGFGPVIQKARSVIGEAATKALSISDDVLIKAKSALPSAKGVTFPEIKKKVKDIRFKFSDIDPQVEEVLKRSDFNEVNAYFQSARNAKANVSKSTPLEIAGTKGEEAFDLISKARVSGIQGKKAILDRVGTQRVSGNTVNEVFANGVREFDSKFGALIDSKGGITQSKGRTLQLDPTDQKLVNEYFRRLSSLGLAPTLREVDDFVDWAQSQLYKQSKTLSKLEVASDPVIRQLQRVTGDLNGRLKDTIQNGYGEVNARISRLIELQDELSRALGADARKGGGLMKNLFSPTGGNTRKIFSEIREETGIDLFKEATLAKFAMETVGDVRQRSLLQNLGVGVEAAGELDITKPLSIVKFIRERADLDGQELANEVIRRFGDQK